MGMIAVRCPNCSADIQLDDSREFGFCNYCGTKVMQDKIVVEHRGSVKVDQSEFVQKSIANGRRALAKEDWEEVEKYYNLVEQNAPDNIEAVFFSSYGKAMLSMTDSDYFKRQQKFNVLINSMSVISDYFETTSEDKEDVLKRIDTYIDKMFNIAFVYNPNLSLSSVGSNQWCRNLMIEVKSTFFIELCQIREKHNDNFIRALIDKNGSFFKAMQTNGKKIKQKNKNELIIAAIILLTVALGFYFLLFLPN